MHPIPTFFLLKRQTYVRSLLKNSLVLDMGCNKYKVVPSSIGLDLEKESKPDVLSTCLKTPFPDNSFDTVTALELIEHFDSRDQDRFLDEVYRILKRKGQFIVSTPNISEATRKLHDFLFYVSHMVYARKDVHAHKGELTHHQLKRKLLNHDFKIKSEKSFSFFNYVVECEK